MRSLVKRAAAGCALWLTVGVVASIPVGLTAQEPIGVDVPERPELRERAEQVLAMVHNRARIGVVLGETREVSGRTGVAVQRVLDGGPAARAGVRAGDVVVSLNDVELGSRPGRRLTALMTEVEPGDTVTVRLHRDGRDQTVRIVTDRATPSIVRFGDAVRDATHDFDPGPMVMERLRELQPAFGPFGRHRLELVAMNPGLGRYFGVEEGVLVADLPPDSPLGLQPGDVIVSIGGRAVHDAAHARSILNSYRAGEGVEIQLVRERRTVTVRGRPAGDAR